MKYNPIDSSLFKENRNKLAKQLPKRALAILNSNDIMPTNADGTMPFRQNNDFFYFTGIDQEESVFLFFPDAINEADREVLFIKETNEHIAIWEGHKLSKEEATQISGIKEVRWLSTLDDALSSLVVKADSVYLNQNEHSRASKVVQTRDDRFRLELMKNYPLHRYERLAPFIHPLRIIKSEEEIKQIRIACGITEKAFRRVLSYMQTGVMEYEVEAEVLHEFLINKANGPAYQSIIASGKNACVLHYIDNNEKCKFGDLVLMDFGAEYANYASDLTRTIPVNGKFTQRQKAVYSEVLSILKYATSLLVVGNTFKEYNAKVAKEVEKSLLKLGLITIQDIENQDPDRPAYRKYFMHGLSHFLGLDTHDVGSYDVAFQAGMVLTCEPGIYIREENIGVRLENDILITESGPENLMESIPIEIEEIESLMTKESKL